MATEFKIQIPPRLQSSAIILEEEIVQELRNSGLIVERAAKKLAPVASGNLRRSIASSVVPIGGSPTAIILAAAKYAPSVESGTKPHTPPLKPISRWASRKGMNGGAVWVSIRRNGTKAHPFMRPAFDDKAPSVIKRMQAAIATAVERMTT